MIPVRLELSNFLSYAGPVQIDFTTFDVACLSGENGAGKSALLDAITYATWGRARGCEGGTNQERLIRDGADEMYVDFTFELQGQTYRIVRRRTAGKGGEVHFLVRADGDRWNNMAEGTLRETDAQIESTLRMNYETFTASAFFVQGRTDDFLRMTPAGRRDVFAKLLDLGTYERLADAAKERAKQAEALRGAYAQTIEKLSGAREECDSIRTELELATTHAEVAATNASEANQRCAEARAALGDVEKAEAVLEAERSQLKAAETALEEWRAALATKEQTAVKLDDVLSRAEEVDEALAEAEQLRAIEEQARAAERTAAELSRRMTEIAGRIDGQRRTLTATHEGLTGRLTRLSDDVAALEELEGKLAAIDETLAETEDPKAAEDDVRTAVASCEKDAARLDEQLRTIDVRSAEIAEKISLLASGGGECPVCGTPLDAAHRTKVKRALESEARSTKRERETAKAARDTVAKETKRCTEDLKRIGKERIEQEKLSAAAAELRARLMGAGDVRFEHASVAQQTQRAAEQLADDAFAADLLEELAGLQSELTSVYDADEHDRLRRRLEELRAFEALHGRIVASRQQHHALAGEICELTERCEAAGGDVAGRRAKLEKREQQIGNAAKIREAAQLAEQQAATAVMVSQQAAATVATLLERLEAACRLRSDLEEAEAAEVAAALQRRRFQRLAEAFGRNGIPQRIIENERPYLEDETNRILGRLSDDPMAVHFRFQGKTKTGKDRETLEILVRPHDGEPRDFAMFSGGEAFKIAFAVRLAMSKLLVRRAGARLETLVVDEGFGTQDPGGRQRLVEAINVARTEFKKVLVITHLEDLKEQFGAQIEVTRGRDGSVLQLVAG